MAKVLVAYATIYGSTQEVAERVAKVLSEQGCAAEAVAASDVTSLDGFDAVVLGAALYFFRPHKDARKFIPRHRRALESMPVAIFGVGPLEDTSEQFDGARDHVGKLADKNPWLEPVSTEVFGGVLAPDKLRFPHSNPAMKEIGASDLRDWDAIEAWARSLPNDLGVS